MICFTLQDLQGKQLAEPQKTAATASVPTATATYCDDNVQHQQLQLLQPPEYSPLSSSASTSRCGELEVSDSISPVMKARKSSSHKNIPDKDLGSPKAKNWKDLLFRRGGGNHNADISPSSLASSAKTTGSIGVPLKSCPMVSRRKHFKIFLCSHFLSFFFCCSQRTTNTFQTLLTFARKLSRPKASI